MGVGRFRFSCRFPQSEQILFCVDPKGVGGDGGEGKGWEGGRERGRRMKEVPKREGIDWYGWSERGGMKRRWRECTKKEKDCKGCRGREAQTVLIQSPEPKMMKG